VRIREVTPEGEELERTLQPGYWDRTLIFQAIPNMYAGRDPWMRFRQREMDDRKFEVVFQGGMFKLGLFQIGVPTGTPICQASSAEIRTREPAFVQLDGEGRSLNRPARIAIQRTGSYPMIVADRTF
jgi:diacylglycerol kinase (ATP)